MIISENDSFVKIRNKYIKETREFETIIDDEMLDDEELTLYTIMNINLTVKGNLVFSLSWLMEVLRYSDNNIRRRNMIKVILNNLIDKQVIKVYDSILMEDKNKIKDISKINKNSFIYVPVEEVEEKFTQIYDKEIFKIIEIADTYKLDIFKLMRLVLYLFSCINCNKESEDYKLCYPSFENISDQTGLTESTIEKYIIILRNEKLIEYDYAGYKEQANGKIKNGHMFYCRYMDRDILIKRIEAERELNGFIKLNKLSKDKSNIKRSISQMINKLESKKQITDIETTRLNLLKEQYKIINNGFEKKNNKKKSSKTD